MASVKDSTTKRPPRERAKKPPPNPHRPLAAIIDREKFAAFCAESSATLTHIFDRLQAVLKVVGVNDEWINRERLLDASHLIEQAMGVLGIMPFEPESPLPNPVETITLASVEARAGA